MIAAKAKIEKLMALARDHAANQFEAEAALRQAAYLMKKHNIEEAELGAASGKSVYNWSQVCVPLAPSGDATSTCTWLGTLGLGIGKFTDTKVDYHRTRDYGMCLRFSGTEVDVQFAVYLCKHLRDQTRLQASQFAGSRADRETFRRAMSSRVIERMEQLRREMEVEMEAHPTAIGTALVVVNRKIVARDEQFGKQVERASSRSAANPRAYSAGQDAGNRVNLSRPLAAQRRALER